MAALARLVRFIFDPFVCVNPIGLPRLTTVVGKGLFKAAGNRSDIRPDPTNKDSSTVKWFLIKRFTAAIFKLADHGLIDGAVIAGSPIVAPLVRFGIVKPKRQTFDMTCRAICFELFEVGTAVPNPSDEGGTFILDPCRRACQRMQTPCQVSLPVSNREIVVTLTITLRSIGWSIFFDGRWFVCYACVGRNPVHFPGFSSII